MIYSREHLLLCSYANHASEGESSYQTEDEKRGNGWKYLRIGGV